MEAIAALGLACNIIQVLDAAHNAAQIVIQIYSHGTALDHIHLEQTTRNLQALSLDTRVADPQLQQIAQSCKSISKELLDELVLLKGKGTGKRDALKKGFRAFQKKGHIEKLKIKLEDHQKTFDTGLLLRLKEQNDMAAITSSANFKTLDKTLQNFITNLGNDITSLDNVLKTEAASTRDHVTKEHAATRTHINQSQLNIMTEQQRQRFLDSFKYPLMNARRNQITSNYPKTFEWIFRDSPEWPSFPKWLASDDKTYFIEGKAASGKSTLMKFIIEDTRTKELLKRWNSSTKILSHYFWLSGDPSQRDLHGMLTSLVYQILVDNNGALPVSVSITKQYPSDWSLIELSALLHDLTMHDHYCLFIDGLDEFGGSDPRSLTDLVESLCSRSNIKICLSSRPEQIYLQQLRLDTRFRLQRLTKADIREFVVARLTQAQVDGRLIDSNISGALVNDIVFYADGVFLWVNIALNSVIRGLESHAPMSELEARMSQLPRDIEGLYENMLRRLGDDWDIVKSEAAFILRFIVFDGESGCHRSIHVPDIVVGSVLFNGESEQTITSTYLARETTRMAARIPVVCAGLVETHEDTGEYRLLLGLARVPQDPRKFELDGLSSYRLSFIHRTARDFLFQQPLGQSIMRLCKLESEQFMSYQLRTDIIIPRCYGYPLLWSGVGSVLGALNRQIWSRPSATTRYRLKMLQYIWCSFLFESETQHGQQMLTQDVFQLAPDDASPELEYHLAKLDPRNNYVAIDYMGLTLELGRPEYFHHFLLPHLRNEVAQKLLSTEYLDYLLLCASRSMSQWDDDVKNQNAMNAIMKLLVVAGACPYTEFFLGPGAPLRVNSEVCMRYDRAALMAQSPYSTDHQANVSCPSAFMLSTGLADFEHIRLTLPRHHGIYLTVRLPAEATKTGGGVQDLANRARDPSRASHWRKMLKKAVLISSGKIENTVWKVSDQDSTALLSIIDDWLDDDRVDQYPSSFDRHRELYINKIDEIISHSEGIDYTQYLKDNGYLKDPSDPAVPQGPIKRFKDGVDASQFPAW